LEEACHLVDVLAGAGREVPLSLNVSPRQFRQSDSVTRVSRALEQERVRPGRFVFEITLGLFVEHLDSTVEQMRELLSLGVRFSVEDF
jgi:EAL domain-containing protein (putative c-di-GMP-specific phosphodiesterase class I)